MTLKYEGDKVTRLKEGSGVGNGGNGGGAITYLFRMFFGNDPSQWVRFFLLGGLVVYAWFSVLDFRNKMIAEGIAVRQALSTYVAANEKWQATTLEERKILIGRADRRFKRLYDHNGWEYQGLGE